MKNKNITLTEEQELRVAQIKEIENFYEYEVFYSSNKSLWIRGKKIGKNNIVINCLREVI